MPDEFVSIADLDNDEPTPETIETQDPVDPADPAPEPAPTDPADPPAADAPADPADDNGDPADPDVPAGDDADFWNELATEAELEDGEFDPSKDATASEVAAIIKKVKETSYEAARESLEKDDPRAYAYRLHRLAGKADDEFFGAEAEYSLPSLDAVLDNEQLQEQIVTEQLRGKKVGDRIIAATIKQAKADGELQEMAEEAHKELDESKTERQTAQTKSLEEAHQKKVDDIHDFADVMKEIILDKGELKNLKLDKKDGEAFLNDMKNNIVYKDGGFFIVTPVTKDDLADKLEAQYFAFKKGDLKSMVTKEAKTIGAGAARARAKSGKSSPSGSSGGRDSTNSVTFGEV